MAWAEAKFKTGINRLPFAQRNGDEGEIIIAPPDRTIFSPARNWDLRSGDGDASREFGLLFFAPGLGRLQNDGPQQEGRHMVAQPNHGRPIILLRPMASALTVINRP